MTSNSVRRNNYFATLSFIYFIILVVPSFPCLESRRFDVAHKTWIHLRSRRSWKDLSGLLCCALTQPQLYDSETHNISDLERLWRWSHDRRVHRRPLAYTKASSKPSQWERSRVSFTWSDLAPITFMLSLLWMRFKKLYASSSYLV